MRKQNSIIRILILVFAVLIVCMAIFDGVYYFISKNKLQTIALQPDFAETSLEVGTQYTFTINTKPSGANIKKTKCVVDDPTCSFELNSDGKAILTTGMTEGQVTVYVECKDIKSQVMTFSIVDSVARAQAEAAAQAEEQKKAEEAAAAAAEAEAAAQVKKYVKCTGDDVNVRSTNSTDGEVLGKAKKGYMFEKIEDVDDWTHIKYKDQDGYMKTEFLTEISEEEYNEGPSEEETKKEEEEKAEEERKKKEEEAKKKAEEAKAQQADATAAVPETPATPAVDPSLLTPYTLSGVPVTATQYRNLLDMFRFATPNGTDAEAKAEVEIHSGAEIRSIIQDKGW